MLIFLSLCPLCLFFHSKAYLVNSFFFFLRVNACFICPIFPVSISLAPVSFSFPRALPCARCSFCFSPPSSLYATLFSTASLSLASHRTCVFLLSLLERHGLVYEKRGRERGVVCLKKQGRRVAPFSFLFLSPPPPLPSSALSLSCSLSSFCFLFSRSSSL